MPNYDAHLEIGSLSVFTIKSNRWKQNAYVLFDRESSKLIVVDPGGEEKKIENCIEELKGDIDGIYLTHAHHDHVGGLAHLCEKYKKKFSMDQGDYKIFRRAPMFALTFEARELVIPKNCEVFYGPEIFAQDDLNGVKCISTPGHTAGGVVVKVGKVAFTGDTLLNKMVGRTDLPGACSQLLAGSIEHFLSELSDDTILFPGHGGPWTVKEAKEWWNNNSSAAPEFREESPEGLYD